MVVALPPADRAAQPTWRSRMTPKASPEARLRVEILDPAGFKARYLAEAKGPWKGASAGRADDRRPGAGPARRRVGIASCVTPSSARATSRSRRRPPRRPRRGPHQGREVRPHGHPRPPHAERHGGVPGRGQARPPRRRPPGRRGAPPARRGPGGELPAALADVTVVPVPLDPVTGKPFEYRLEGETAVLVGPATAGRCRGSRIGSRSASDRPPRATRAAGCRRAGPAARFVPRVPGDCPGAAGCRITAPRIGRVPVQVGLSRPTPRPKPNLRKSMHFQGFDSGFLGSAGPGPAGDRPWQALPEKTTRIQDDNIRLWKIGFARGAGPARGGGPGPPHPRLRHQPGILHALTEATMTRTEQAFLCGPPSSQRASRRRPGPGRPHRLSGRSGRDGPPRGRDDRRRLADRGRRDGRLDARPPAGPPLVATMGLAEDRGEETEILRGADPVTTVTVGTRVARTTGRRG